VSQTVSKQSLDAIASLDGAELNTLLGFYLCNAAHSLQIVIEEDLTGGREADFVLWQLIAPELAEIAQLHDRQELNSVIMIVTEFTVCAAAVTMHEPPPEAILAIGNLLAILRARLQHIIDDHRDKPKNAA
jgi:hypothetical protein